MKPGHSTDTFTGEPDIASSNASASEIPTTACFVAVYGLMNGSAFRPAIDAVLIDVAFILLDQPGHERADAVEHAPEVDAERPVPTRLRDLPHQAAAAAHPCVVADDVRGAEVPVRAGREVDHLILDRHVGHDVEHIGAAGAQLLGRLGESCRFDVREHDLHALGGERLGETEPDPARPARHHCHLAAQLVHRCEL